MVKLAAEKCLNKYVFPVINLKGKKVSYPFTIRHNDWGFGCFEGIIGPKNLMILDILGTSIIHQIYNDRHGGTIEYKDKIPTPNDGRVKLTSGKHISKKLLWYVFNRYHSLQL